MICLGFGASGIVVRTEIRPLQKAGENSLAKLLRQDSRKRNPGMFLSLELQMPFSDPRFVESSCFVYYHF